MFISPAYAQAADGGAGASLTSFLPLIAIVVIFYFLLIRPQQKRFKAHKAMVAAVARGDIVVTGGGLVGKVSKLIGEEEVEVELGPDMRVRVIKATISEVRGKKEPAKVEAKAK